jgi:hypothetical protein
VFVYAIKIKNTKYTLPGVCDDRDMFKLRMLLLVIGL